MLDRHAEALPLCLQSRCFSKRRLIQQVKQDSSAIIATCLWRGLQACWSYSSKGEAIKWKKPERKEKQLSNESDSCGTWSRRPEVRSLPHLNKTNFSSKKQKKFCSQQENSLWSTAPLFTSTSRKVWLFELERSYTMSKGHSPALAVEVYTAHSAIARTIVAVRGPDAVAIIVSQTDNAVTEDQNDWRITFVRNMMVNARFVRDGRRTLFCDGRRTIYSWCTQTRISARKHVHGAWRGALRQDVQCQFTFICNRCVQSARNVMAEHVVAERGPKCSLTLYLKYARRMSSN